MKEAIESQQDEIEALKAIYGKDFSLFNDKQSFDLRICCDEIKWWAVTISVVLPSTYPKSDPPLFEVFTECFSFEELQNIHKELDKIWDSSKGESVLYVWVEKIRDILFEKYEQAKLFIESTEEEIKRDKILTDLMRDEAIEKNKQPETITDIPVVKTDIVTPKIVSGETITLKKSTFQGHAAIVYTLDEMKAVLCKLKENRKVAQATHNIVAYRLTGVNETSFIQDYADDGEVNAGGRMLRLLQIMDVKNIVVVVTRWYGGVLLGPDRFRLINNTAREVIIALGAYSPKHEKTKSKHKK